MNKRFNPWTSQNENPQNLLKLKLIFWYFSHTINGLIRNSWTSYFNWLAILSHLYVFDYNLMSINNAQSMQWTKIFSDLFYVSIWCALKLKRHFLCMWLWERRWECHMQINFRWMWQIKLNVTSDGFEEQMKKGLPLYF